MLGSATWRSSFLFLSLFGLAVSQLGSSVGAQGIPTAMVPDRLDDPSYVARLLQHATLLCDSGQTRTLKELKLELDRGAVLEPTELCPASASELTVPQLYSVRCRSVLTIVRLYKCNKCQNWHMGNEATAFALNAQGVLATCRHVFELPDDGPMIAADQDGNVFPIKEVLATSASDDVAIIRIDPTVSRPVGAPGPEPVPLRAGAPVGTAIGIVSHPGNQHYIFTRGMIARRTIRAGGINGRDSGRSQVPATVLNVTAEFAVGSSGAPVLDDAGNAVGMVVSTMTVHAEGKREGEPQMVLRNCIGAEQIQRLLQPKASVTVGAGSNAHP